MSERFSDFCKQLGGATFLSTPMGGGGRARDLHLMMFMYDAKLTELLLNISSSFNLHRFVSHLFYLEMINEWNLVP